MALKYLSYVNVNKHAFHPQAPLASETAQFFPLAYLSCQHTVSLDYRRSRGPEPGAHAHGASVLGN